MKVLIIAQYFPPDMGGGATRAFNVAKGLASNGCSVTIVTAFPHYPDGEIPRKYRGKLISVECYEKLKVFRTFVPPLPSKGLPRRVLLYISFMLSSLFALPFVGRVGVVWAANPNVIAVFPSLIYKIAKHCPIVQNADDLWPESLQDLDMLKNYFMIKLGEFFARIAYKFASAITPISPAYMQIMLNKYDVDPKKIRAVPCGVDLDRFCLEVNDGLRKHDGKFTVLYIGAFSPAYDFDQVFRAAKLLASYSDIKFIIQGGGELDSALKSRLHEMKLRNFTIIDKIVSREEVARILSEADALLLPLSGASSIEMGISSKLYEYQASGKPIICCSIGEPGHYVSETKSGIVVKPRDHEALAKSVLYLRENRDIAKKFGESGRQYVEDNLSIERIGMRMKEVLEMARATGN